MNKIVPIIFVLFLPSAIVSGSTEVISSETINNVSIIAIIILALILLGLVLRFQVGLKVNMGR